MHSGLKVCFLRYSRQACRSSYSFYILQDEKTTAKRTSDIMQNNLGRKRSGEPDSCDLKEDGNGSGKRARPTTKVSEPEESFKEMERSTDVSKHNASSSGTSSIGDVDSGPAQQLVAMFGALVAQGEKAIGSLQILISSISADLLAEVVIANMRFLPPHQPDAGDGELLQNMSIMGSDAEVKYPSSFVADVLSLSSTFPPIASLLDSSRSFSDHTVLQNFSFMLPQNLDHIFRGVSLFSLFVFIMLN